MKAWKVQLITISVISLLYLLVLGLFFSEQLKLVNLVSILVVGSVFLLSSLIMSTGKELEPESRVQRFILGTTMQILVALFNVLIAKFAAPKEFKGMVVHFMILFVSLLAAQATILVFQVRRKG
jgi:hypothetical protein